MKKLLIILFAISILPCVAFSESGGFAGMEVSVKNDTFSYSIRRVEMSSYFSRTQTEYIPKDNYYYTVKRFYGIFEEGDPDYTLFPDVKECYKNKETKVNCIDDSWFSNDGPEVQIWDKYHPPMLFDAHALAFAHYKGGTYDRLYYERHFFNNDGQEVPIDASKNIKSLDFTNLSSLHKEWKNHKNGWQSFPGIIQPNGSISLSFIQLGDEPQNMKFDIYNEDNIKISSAVIIIDNHKDCTYFLTKPIPGLKMDFGTIIIGKYPHYTYNLTES